MLELDRNKQETKWIWKVPSFTISFSRYPGHWFLILDVLGSIYLCAFCGLRVFLFCEYCSTFCWMTWQHYRRERDRMGSKPSIPVVKLPRDTVVIVTGASSGEIPPFFLTPPSHSHVSKPSSHFIQTKSNYFLGVEDIILETFITLVICILLLNGGNAKLYYAIKIEASKFQ